VSGQPRVSPKQLHLLLAPKERFEAGGAGAFALNVLETSLASRWQAGITVFGSPVTLPFPGIRFHPVEVSRWSLRGRNVAMVGRYMDMVKGNPPDLVEIYNRPVMIQPLKRQLARVPIALHFGNDPRGMDGSRSIDERRELQARCGAIICVSDFIRRCFLEGVNEPHGERVCVIHTGVSWSDDFPTQKRHKIIFVGRIVPEKGVLPLVEALARVLPAHSDWSAEIIGARWFGNAGSPSDYEQKVSRVAKDCDRIVLSGFKPHDQVVASLRTANIAVVPSLWDDPFPRTALEALAQGCALICSRNGGIAEIGAQRALFLDTISADAIAGALERLISNDTERLALQRRGWESSPFDIVRTTRQLDDLRGAIMQASPGR
jgi:glycosyltransferase involved in cell wall biosynthesis